MAAMPAADLKRGEEDNSERAEFKGAPWSGVGRICHQCFSHVHEHFFAVIVRSALFDSHHGGCCRGCSSPGWRQSQGGGSHPSTSRGRRQGCCHGRSSSPSWRQSQGGGSHPSTSRSGRQAEGEGGSRAWPSRSGCQGQGQGESGLPSACCCTGTQVHAYIWSMEGHPGKRADHGCRRRHHLHQDGQPHQRSAPFGVHAAGVGAKPSNNHGVRAHRASCRRGWPR